MSVASNFDMISYLPFDIRIEIFDLLPVDTLGVVERVSKNWARLSSNDRLWRKFDLNLNEDKNFKAQFISFISDKKIVRTKEELNKCISELFHQSLFSKLIMPDFKVGLEYLSLTNPKAFLYATSNEETYYVSSFASGTDETLPTKEEIKKAHEIFDYVFNKVTVLGIREADFGVAAQNQLLKKMHGEKILDPRSPLECHKLVTVDINCLSIEDSFVNDILQKFKDRDTQKLS